MVGQCPEGLCAKRNAIQIISQWQQAKRAGKDPKSIKGILRDCWAVSDTQASFQQALKEQGYTLVKGSRRSFVAIDQQCEIFAIPRWLGIRVKEVRSKLTNEEILPDVEAAKAQIAMQMTSQLSELQNTQQVAINSCISAIQKDLFLLNQQHSSEREELSKRHEQRIVVETIVRQKRFNKGLQGFIDRFTGKRRQIRAQNKQETKLAKIRDQKEKDVLIFEQFEHSRKQRSRIERLKDFSEKKQHSISSDLVQYHEIKQGSRDKYEYHRQPSRKGLELER